MKASYIAVLSILAAIACSLLPHANFKPDVIKIIHYPNGSSFAECLNENGVIIGKKALNVEGKFTYCFVIDGYVDVEEYKKVHPGGRIWREGNRLDDMRCIAVSKEPPSHVMFNVSYASQKSKP